MSSAGSKQSNSRSRHPAAVLTPAARTPEIESGYRWIVVIGTFCASTIGVVDRIAWGNVSTFYAHAMGTSITALGSFFSAFYVGYLTANALSGFAADRFGGRRMITLTLVLLGMCTFAFSLTTSIVAGLITQCAMGLVAGMDFSACLRLLSDVFPPEKRATAMGLFLPSLAVGMTLPNLFIPTLLHAYGWEGVYRALGVLTVAVGIGVYCLLGEQSEIYARRVRSSDRSFQKLIRNRGFRVSALAGFGHQWGWWGFAFWSNALLIKVHHIDPVRAGFIIATFGAVGFVTKPLAGWIVDHSPLSKTGVGTMTCLMFSLSLAAFSLVSTPASFTFFAAMMGITSAFSGVLVATFTITTAGTQYSGSAAGLASSLWSLGNVLVPLVVGAVFQYFHSFRAAVLVLALGPAFGTACFIRLGVLGVGHEREKLALDTNAEESPA